MLRSIKRNSVQTNKNSYDDDREWKALSDFIKTAFAELPEIGNEVDFELEESNEE